nr:MarR family transcriptional regulator [Staphylococcus gallinarum]
MNLSKGQFVYLIRIFENTGIIQEQLVVMLRIDRATISRAIKNKEQNRIITKKN